jgi:hypothetical protein
MQGQMHIAAAPRRALFGRAFVVLAALWAVAQLHHGLWLGSWRDQASLPGNICWLLILYCLLRLGLDGVDESWRDRRPSPDMLLLLLAPIVLEITLRITSQSVQPEMGQLVFFAQPLIVLIGFAALHRRQSLRA